MASGKYEYNIEGTGGGVVTNNNPVIGTPSQSQPKNIPPQKSNTVPGQAQGSTILPKRTPNSELTSYQSEKRLKEYKAQQ